MSQIQWPAKKLRALIVVAFVSVFSISAHASSIAVQLLDGTEFNTAGDPRGKPVLLKFWATWCVACLQEMPAYTAFYEKYGQDVQFLAVNVAVSDPIERVRDAVTEHRLDMPVTYDESGTLWDQFNVVGTPTYVLLNSEGDILHRSYGHDDALEAAVEAAVASGEHRTAPLDAATVDDADSNIVDIVDIDGNLIDLAVDDGEILVAYHIAVWCASYVEESYPELSAKCREFDERISALRQLDIPKLRLVGFVSAYSTNEASVPRYREKRGIKHPLVYDDAIRYGSHFGTRGFPHITIVAPGGRIVYSGDEVPEQIAELLRDRRQVQ